MIAKDSEHPRSRKIGPAPNVNVTPMIDVLLVLLIIFMVVAPTRPAKFETKIPGKATGATQPSQDLLMIVAGNGSGEDQTVSLNSRPMQLAELRVVLRDILEERADKTVYIKAPAWKRYSDVVAVVDSARAARAAPIALQIDSFDDQLSKK